MAFHGDLFSYPLPELLQWVDSTLKTGTLQISWHGGDRKLFVAAGQVVATSSGALYERIARTLEAGGLAKGHSVLAAFSRMRTTGDLKQTFAHFGIEPELISELARDELLGAIADLTQAEEARFHWTEDPDRTGEEWLMIEIGLRHLLFESMRWVDEQRDVERTLPLDSMIVQALVQPEASMPAIHRLILSLCERGMGLGKLRLAIGVGRTAVMRRVYDLLRQKRVDVEGAPSLEADPVAEMLEKGAQLVQARQFEAAELVSQSLLTNDPTDRRVAEFARMVEREHVAAMYHELPPVLVLELVHDAEAMSLLRPDERQVTSLINGRWDVSTVVLASQNRELETLRSLARLNRRGLLRVVQSVSGSPSPKH